MKSLVILGVTLLTMLTVGCAKQMPLVLNFEEEPIPSSLDGKTHSHEAVQKAILKACRNKGWSASIIEPGKIAASVTIRSRHRAKIEIEFTTAYYSIRYMDSMGLEYHNGHIHSRYNHWVAGLDAEIKKAFGLRTQRF